MRNKVIVAAAICLLAVTAVGLSCVRAQRGHEPPAPVSSANISDVDPEYVGDDEIVIPRLTSAERARAVEIALADSRVKELLEGKKYAVEEVGVWHTADLEKLGASVYIRLEREYQIEYDWPVIKWDEESPTSPLGREVRDRAALPVQGLDVLVYLAEERVVAIMPM